MGFRYPHHWLAASSDAFEAAPDEHDHHGFSQRFIAEMEDRDRYLEDYLDKLSALNPVVFDFQGPLVVAVSDLFCPPVSVAYSKIQFSLRSTGTTSTVVGVYKNGASIGTATIPAATALYAFPISISLGGGVDTLQLRVSTAGTGAQGLVGALG